MVADQGKSGPDLLRSESHGSQRSSRVLFPGIQGYRSCLVECLEKDIDACLAYMSHPASGLKHIRTTNVVERSFREVKRRVKEMEQFPTEESCICILFTVLQAQNDVWEGRPIKHFGDYTS